MVYFLKTYDTNIIKQDKNILYRKYMKSISQYIKTQNISFDGTLDIDDLLKGVKIDEYDHINIDIHECVYRSLLTIHLITMEYLTEIKEKLKQYRLVDDIYLLHKGKQVRWINKEIKEKKKNLLQTGGIVVDVKFALNGINVVIFNEYNKRCMQIQFDKVLLFQKLSFEEEMILHLKSTI
jgi:hypothetical protein